MPDLATRYCPRCGTETHAIFCAADGTATVTHAVAGAVTSTTFEAGAIIGDRYRVIDTIGRGGFGAVYSAEHTGTGQDIALKVMLSDQADVDRAAVRRFYKEAQVTAQLKHPNTVRVFDVGQTAGGALYIAMEMLHGPTLEDVLRELGAQGTAMTERAAIDFAIPVLRSLGEAHTLDLVHRDLKPANIILSEVVDDEPVVKVLDFGIARTRDSSLTGAGTALGTPAYMSPEQCLGRAVDGRSDVYALGVILFRAVTGRTPFDDRNPLTLMYKHAHEPPPNPRPLAKSEISEGFVACVLRALAKPPEERFASARDMRTALEAVREGSWRPAMDGQDSELTVMMRRSIVSAERPVPPGDTIPYKGEELGDTFGLDVIEGPTAPAPPELTEPPTPAAQLESGKTVAYADAPAPTSRPSDTAVTPLKREPAPRSEEFAALGGEQSAPPRRSRAGLLAAIAVLCAGGLAAGAFVLMSGGGDTPPSALDARKLARPSTHVAAKTAVNPVPAPVAEQAELTPDSGSQPDASDETTAVGDASARPSDAGSEDATTTPDIAAAAPPAAAVETAPIQRKKARPRTRQQTRKSHKTKVKAVVAPAPPAPQPAPPPAPGPRKPVALD